MLPTEPLWLAVPLWVLRTGQGPISKLPWIPAHGRPVFQAVVGSEPREDRAQVLPSTVPGRLGTRPSGCPVSVAGPELVHALLCRGSQPLASRLFSLCTGYLAETSCGQNENPFACFLFFGNVCFTAMKDFNSLS